MEPFDIKQQLEGLATSVERYKPDQVVSATVGKQGNALRDELASALPDNPVIAATPPFRVGEGKYIAGMKAADVAAVLRALANQVPAPAQSARGGTITGGLADKQF
jgi:hypothetical protein